MESCPGDMGTYFPSTLIETEVQLMLQSFVSRPAWVRSMTEIARLGKRVVPAKLSM